MEKTYFITPILVTTLLVSLSGCAGMSNQDKNTAVGAGAGAIAGSILTGGGAMGTIGGAAVGGIIGHETSKEKNDNRHHHH